MSVGPVKARHKSDGRPRLTLIVAVARNGVIGRDGELPWRLPADLARFKRLTMGHAMVMGRKTFESIGRPLPGRLSVVLTRDPQWASGHPEVLVARSLEGAIDQASNASGVAADEVFVIGGGEVYRLALPFADRLAITRVAADVSGDATFPSFNAASEWRLLDAEEHPADDRNEHPFVFENWERVRNA